MKKVTGPEDHSRAIRRRTEDIEAVRVEVFFDPERIRMARATRG